MAETTRRAAHHTRGSGDAYAPEVTDGAVPRVIQLTAEEAEALWRLWVYANRRGLPDNEHLATARAKLRASIVCSQGDWQVEAVVESEQG